ncbi:MAG: hypothetical protein JOY80_07465, partial [Candidatus Dormibacteraeota bacterium]|nr:hypothetical protein [Candidatus Dormibacteraeota bacterium]
MRLQFTGALLAAGLLAGTALAFAAPGAASTGSAGLPSLPAISLPPTPTLPGATPPVSTPTPAPSSTCAAPVISGIRYDWSPAPPPPGSTAPMPTWPQPGGQPSPQVAPWAGGNLAGGDTGTLTVTGTHLWQPASLTQGPCTPVLQQIGSVTLQYPASAESGNDPTQPQQLVFDFSAAQPLPAQPAQAATPPSPTNPSGTSAQAPNIASGAVVVASRDTSGDWHLSNEGTNPQPQLVQEPLPSSVDNQFPHELDPVNLQEPSGGLSQFEAGSVVSGGSVLSRFDGCPDVPGGVALSSVAAEPDIQKQPTDLDLIARVPYEYCNGTAGFRFWFGGDATKPAYCLESPPPGQQANCISFDVPGAKTIDVQPEVSQVDPNPVGPGGVVLVDGSGFGDSGSAAIDGTPLTSLIHWNDKLLEFQVPKQTGTFTVNIHRDNTPADTRFQLTIQTGAPGSPLHFPYSIYTGGPVSFVPGHLGAPPGGARSSGGTALKLSLASTKADAGSDVKYTVSLVLAGRPLADAPVTFTVVTSPGPDTKLRPASGKTNAQGKLTGVLHLSSVLGTTILLARSGTYSDEAAVLGQKPVAKSNLPFGLNIDLSGNPLIAWLAIATVLLILLGIIVNLEVLRRFLWSITFGAI